MNKQEIMEQQDLVLENWIKELVENAHKDDRKPHEKVVDTTVNKSPAFYDGLQVKSFVTNNWDTKAVD